MTDTPPIVAQRLVIPDGLVFAALHLRRDQITHDVDLDWAPIEQICEASGLDVAVFRDGPEDNLATLVITWYRAHREAGGAADPGAEQIISEVEAEDAHGAHRIISGGGVQ